MLGKSLTLELHPSLPVSTLDRPVIKRAVTEPLPLSPTQLLVNAVLDFLKLVSGCLSNTRMQCFLDVEKQMVCENKYGWAPVTVLLYNLLSLCPLKGVISCIPGWP